MSVSGQPSHYDSTCIGFYIGFLSGLAFLESNITFIIDDICLYHHKQVMSFDIPEHGRLFGVISC